MNKPTILTFIGSYLPGYKFGGPVRTISNMVDRLGDELDFRIVTSDRDFKDTKPYPNVDLDRWNTVGKAKVFYASPKNRSVRSMARLICETPHDVLYLNSFFSKVFTIHPLLARYFRLIPKRPTILAPRGEFSEGALALKRWKKHFYLNFIKVFKLYRDIVWQASSKYEADDIRNAIGSAADRIIITIVIAPDLPSVSNTITSEKPQAGRAPGDSLRVCFLSRISPKKNLDYALQVLADVNVPIEFSIYGVMEDEPYWQHCQELIKKLPAHVVVRYNGAIAHANVAAELAKHDLFFFPTRGENYGHVIFEALTSGLPVLLSDQTPWRNLEVLGVGWDLPLSAPEKFRTVIEAQAKLNGEARSAQRCHIRQHAHLISTDNKVISDTIALFKDVIVKE